MKIPKIQFSRKTVFAIAIILIVALLIIFGNTGATREVFCMSNPIYCIRRGW
jgi:hypothetical protein